MTVFNQEKINQEMIGKLKFDELIREVQSQAIMTMKDYIGSTDEGDQIFHSSNVAMFYKGLYLRVDTIIYEYFKEGQTVAHLNIVRANNEEYFEISVELLNYVP